MTGNGPHDLDELLVTGIPPVAEPLMDTSVMDTPTARAPAVERPVVGTAAGETLVAETPVAGGSVGEAEPVFVDATGLRARLGRRFGLAAGAVLVVFLGALGLGMATGPSVPLTPWSEPSSRPRVQVSRPDVPTEKPGDRRAAGRPGPEPTRPGERAAPSPPPRPSSAAPPGRMQVPATSTSRPGKSQASPPAWGRKKKNH